MLASRSCAWRSLRAQAMAHATGPRRSLAVASQVAVDSTDHALESLIAYGERVLRTREPAQKVALTLECLERWRTGSLAIWSGPHWKGDPPQQPARSEKPLLLPPKQMPSPKHMPASIPVVMLHALAHIELGAIDNYWDTLVRFDPVQYQLPRDFYSDFLTVASDEARHFLMVDDRLRELGSFYGDLPATTALLEHAANTTAALAARIAVVPLVQEARGLDSGERLVHKLRSVGDKASAAVVAQIVYEERSHVAYGIKWFKHLCAHVAHVAPVSYFHELVLEHFPEGLPGPFDMQARLAANMEVDWYEPLAADPRHKCAGSGGAEVEEEGGHNTSSSSSASSGRRAAFLSSQKKVILAGTVWPERTSSAAGVRSSDLIAVLQAHGYQVLCVSPSRLNTHTEALASEQGVKCVQADANTDTFAKLLMETSPCLVLFDRFIAEEMYGWQVQQYAPTALRVLDLQDVHFLRRAREYLVKKQDVPFTETLDLQTLSLGNGGLEKHTIRELAAMHRSDLTLYVSENERDVLTKRFEIPERLLHRCDFFYDTAQDGASSSSKSFAERRDIAFIGSFKHAPNVDAIEWMKHSIWPSFREQMRAQHAEGHDGRSGGALHVPEMHIYGSYSQDAKKYQKLDDPANGFRLAGFAPNVHDTLALYRLSVAPLRFGAGVKGKIADSWFVGTPCVSTSIGAEGMHQLAGSSPTSEQDGAMPWGGLIADDPEAFARSMQQLYGDETAWTASQRIGQRIVSTRYDRSQNASSLMTRLDRALAERERARQENWTGRILWSEKYRATEFMSRYIRVKNEQQQQQLELSGVSEKQGSGREN